MGYLDDNGLLYLWIKIKNLLSNKVDKVSGKQLSTNDYTTADKTKLNGIATGATKVIVEQSLVNQSSNPLAGKVVQEMIANVMDGVTELGNQLDGKVDKVTGKGLSTNDYTTTEKNKLSGIASGANNYVHLTTAGNKHIPAGGSSGQFLKWSADGTAVWAADNNTTYGLATTTADGLMAKGDKSKLDGIATGADKNQNAYGSVDWNGATVSAGSINDTISFNLIGDVFEAYTDSVGDGKRLCLGLREVTSSRSGLMGIADKMKLDAFGAASTYALKSDIVGMYKYKGSVADASKLPTTGQTTGDVYNIVAPSIYGAAGANVAWDGSKWDSLGEIFTITSITNAQIDTICA